jgi:hypothetical protein
LRGIHVRLEIIDDDGGAGFRHGERGRQAEAMGGAGDHGRLLMKEVRRRQETHVVPERLGPGITSGSPAKFRPLRGKSKTFIRGARNIQAIFTQT